MASVAISPLGTVTADDEFSIEGIRRELREAAAKSATQGETASEKPEEFAFSDKDLEAANKELAAAEAALLKKLDDAPKENAQVPTTGSQLPSENAAASEITTQIAATTSLGTETIPSAASTSDSNLGEKNAVSVETNGKPLTVASTASSTAPTQSVPGLPSTIGASSSQNLRGKDPKETVIRDQIQEIASLRKVNADLSKKVQKLETQLATAQRRANEAQNRLMLAETEVERLSNVIDSRNRMTASKMGGNSTVSAQNAPQVSAKTAAPRTEDVPVVTVIAEKANLRTGPSGENSPLMAVSKGTRLVVEKREGEWYRVITPSGTRAWVSAEVVAFGPTDTSRRSQSTLSIGGFNQSLEKNRSGITSNLPQ